ncbi:unnamed protein product [Schistosoma mattheei]|uniref:Uncharacterized protein n=1 Tax=Schistosoma mattheei TaxID=31246 RepID=A0A183NXU9_9TREM|nr:unnamed protein product [Schistosoma mattheei]
MAKVRYPSINKRTIILRGSSFCSTLQQRNMAIKSRRYS